MKKNFALALAAIFALLLASAFADNDIEPADILRPAILTASR